MRRWHSMLLLSLLSAAACSDDPDPVVPNVNAVTVTNNAFNPSSRTISVGGTVTWVWNSGGTAHNVTFTPGTAGAPSNIAQATSGSFPRVFNTAGTFNYSCTIHGPPMTGSVIVNP